MFELFCENGRSVKNFYINLRDIGGPNNCFDFNAP